MDDSTKPVDPSNDVLCADIVHLGVQITDAVNEAFEKFRAKAVKESETKEKAYQAAKSNIEQLNAQLAGYKRENDFLRKQLVGILQSHNQSLESQVRDGGIRGTSSTSGPVPYTDYERLSQKVDALQQQLLRSNQQHKTEATARRLLISKMRDSKNIARLWMEYHHQYEEKTKKVLAKYCRHQSRPETQLNIGNEASRSRVATISPLAKPDPPSPGLGRLNDIVHSTGRLLVPDDNDLFQGASERDLVRPLHPAKANGSSPEVNAQYRMFSTIGSAAQLPKSQEETMEMPGSPREAGGESERVGSLQINDKMTTESTDDGPTVLNMKGSKRQRIDRSLQNNGIPNGQVGRSLVKMEIAGDDITALASVLKRTATVDLDEVGSRIETPRKRQRREIDEIMRLTSGKPISFNSTFRQERFLSEPLLDTHETQLYGFGDSHESDPRKGGDSSSTTGLGLTELPPFGDHRPGSEPLILSTITSARPVVSSSMLSNERPALSPVDVNTSLLPIGKAGTERKTRNGGHSRGADAIDVLAEDGTSHQEDEILESRVSGLKETPNLKISSGRLNLLLEQGPTLLNLQIPATTPSSRLKDPRPKTTTSRVSKEPPVFKIPDLPKGVRRDLPESITPKAQDSKGYKTHQTTRPISPTVQPPLHRTTRPSKLHIPCRDRSPTSLHKDDFRLNPNHNFGLDYAFSEPIRGRAARQCAPGCIDERCCRGTMRALATDLRPTLPRPLYPNSPEDMDLTDDELLLKHHLGSRWDREHVASIPAVEREELLLQARTRLLAERYGRHKVTSERRKSPPGFWRTEMPSTPELEQDREAAERMDRETVQERYEEAMRGGRWKFRDE